MLGEIERLNENELDNSQVRILIAAERAPIDHHSTNIDRLYRYWQERHLIDGDVPAESDFHPPVEQSPWVDVSVENPMNFMMNNHPAGVCGNWERKRFADHPVRIHAKACAREYYLCKQTRQPTYIYTRQEMLGINREYAKILLPLAGANGEISRVIYAWRFLSEPKILSRMN